MELARNMDLFAVAAAIFGVFANLIGELFLNLNLIGVKCDFNGNLFFTACSGANLMHDPQIWNHDGVQGGILMGMHEYHNEEHHQRARKPGEVTSAPVPVPPPERKGRDGGRRNGGDGGATVLVALGSKEQTVREVQVDAQLEVGDEQKSPGKQVEIMDQIPGEVVDAREKMYLVKAADLEVAPAYENTVNPFLSHLEQAWKLKPVRHRYMRKKLLQQQHLQKHLSPQQQQKMGSGASLADELFGPLPEDKEKAHFMESGEASDAEG